MAKVHQVIIFQPGDRVVTEVEIEPGVTDLKYWAVNPDGSWKLINPSPEDVAGYKMGQPV